MSQLHEQMTSQDGLAAIVAAGALGEVFHLRDGTGREVWIDVAACWYLIGRDRVGPMPFRFETRGHVEAFRAALARGNDLNIPRALALPQAVVDAATPILVLLEDGTSMAICASHRLWRQLGDLLAGRRADVRGYMVEMSRLLEHGIATLEPPEGAAAVIMLDSATGRFHMRTPAESSAELCRIQEAPANAAPEQEDET